MAQNVIPADFPTFRLFMGAYWNQVADQTYGTLAKALEQFASDTRKTDESTEYFSKLLLEMREVKARGFALKLDGVEAPEVSTFWIQAGGRGLSAYDFDIIDEFLKAKILS